MPTIMWMSVFVFLCFELFVGALLVIPAPRFFRRFLARKICAFNLADSYYTMYHLNNKIREEVAPMGGIAGQQMGYAPGVSMDKMRKFRAERNMYLAGFALACMFAIARVVELMQSEMEKEMENESLKKRLADRSETETASQVTNLEDSTENTRLGEPGNTPFVLRRRSVTTNGDNADHED